MASSNMMPIACQSIGGVAAISIGFGFDLHETYSLDELILPVYASLVLLVLIRIARDSLKKHVRVLMQYDTEVGIVAIEGKELHFRA